jgi:CheY-like chemotaxis protein
LLLREATFGDRLPLLRQFCEFHGCELVEHSTNRVVLVLLDDDEQQRESALAVSDASKEPVLLVVLTDAEPSRPDARFMIVMKATWVLQIEDILQRAIRGDGVCVQTGMAAGPTSFPDLSVLVVDGDATDQLVLKKILEKFGCGVTIAATGDEGLDRLRNGAFGLAILSRLVPLGDGRTVGDALRTRPECLRVPIIVLTENSFAQADIDECRETGITHFLKKPLTIHSVGEALRDATG